jgi:hypothetical protein
VPMVNEAPLRRNDATHWIKDNVLRVGREASGYRVCSGKRAQSLGEAAALCVGYNLSISGSLERLLVFSVSALGLSACPSYCKVWPRIVVLPR